MLPAVIVLSGVAVVCLMPVPVRHGQRTRTAIGYGALGALFGLLALEIGVLGLALLATAFALTAIRREARLEKLASYLLGAGAVGIAVLLPTVLTSQPCATVETVHTCFQSCSYNCYSPETVPILFAYGAAAASACLMLGAVITQRVRGSSGKSPVPFR
jgi:Na+/phosphate symporter